jgi:hypothetical protein
MDLLEAHCSRSESCDKCDDRKGCKEEKGAIRDLIESSDKGPEVDEKFVEKWTSLIQASFEQSLDDKDAYSRWHDDIELMLREAGVKIKEEK